MSRTRQFIFTHARGAVAGLALALLAGCNESELRTRVATVESRLDAVPEKPVQAATLPSNASPIRYSAGPDQSHLKNIESMLQQAAVFAPAPFSFRREAGDKIVLSGFGSFGESAEKWLREHGFSKRKNDAWERSMSAADLPDLERKTAEALQVAAHDAEQAYFESRYNSNGPGRYDVKSFYGGSVEYTGHALDIAFADNLWAPEFFIDFGEPQTNGNVPGPLPHTFSRGGRLIVKDGHLRFDGDSIYPVSDRKVPPAATHLSINADGIILAHEPSGRTTDLGQLKFVRVKSFKPATHGFVVDEAADTNEWVQKNGRGPVLPGYIENCDYASINAMMSAFHRKNTLLALQAGIHNAPAKGADASADSDLLPLIIHTPLPKTAEHLKALKIAVEKTNERTTIGANADEDDVANALVSVLQGLRRRLAIHEENLRNAGKTRDSEGRLNAYRRKTVAIGPQGNLVEGVDKSELPKNYKPGDPDAGPDGFVVLSNVNKAVESEDFKGTIDEYKLVRTALERIAPKHVFPDPPAAP